jgi:hypothetical protein
MKTITLLVTLFFATLSIAQQAVKNIVNVGISVQIVEIDVDQTGVDEMEFIELRTASPNQSLEGFIVVFYNGNDDESYKTVDLSGFSSDANGYIILGSDLFPDADILLGPDNTIQNGADAIAIYAAAAANFPNDTPITSDGLIDAIVYGTNDSNDMELLLGLNQTIQWNENENSMKDVESLQYDASTGLFCAGTPTPRAANIDCIVACPLSVLAVSVTCDTETSGTDTYTTIFNFTGGGTETYTITSTEGTITGDSPSSIAMGEFMISGVNEGVHFVYTITSANCDISNTINSPLCIPESTVSNIAELRAGVLGDDYILTSEAIVTFVQDFRNQKFIEDTTAGILIDDNNGIITAALIAGDGITGLSGSLEEFQGMMQFRPNIAITTSSTGNIVVPQLVQVSELNANPNNYESEYVRINTNTIIDAATNPTWITGTIYQMVTGDGDYIFRTSFFDADYIGADVPTSTTKLVSGIITERDDGSYFITARSLSDIGDSLRTDYNAIAGLKITPNPANTHIEIRGANSGSITVQIFDILGKEVIASQNGIRVNIETLRSGIYIVKASQNGATTAAKLIVE